MGPNLRYKLNTRSRHFGYLVGSSHVLARCSQWDLVQDGLEERPWGASGDKWSEGFSFPEDLRKSQCIHYSWLDVFLAKCGQDLKPNCFFFVVVSFAYRMRKKSRRSLYNFFTSEVVLPVQAYYGEPYAEAKRLADMAPQDFCAAAVKSGMEWLRTITKCLGLGILAVISDNFLNQILKMSIKNPMINHCFHTNKSYQPQVVRMLFFKKNIYQMHGHPQFCSLRCADLEGHQGGCFDGTIALFFQQRISNFKRRYLSIKKYIYIYCIYLFMFQWLNLFKPIFVQGKKNIDILFRSSTLRFRLSD